jgi:hypothetical protein
MKPSWWPTPREWIAVLLFVWMVACIALLVSKFIEYYR